MRVVGFYSEDYEQRLMLALEHSARDHGIEFLPYPFATFKNLGGRPGADAIVFVAMTANRQILMDHYAGLPWMYMDKGYVRAPGPLKTKWWRVSIDAMQPTKYLKKLPEEPARWKATDVMLLPRNEEGQSVMVAGSTNRYHAWHRLPPPMEWAREVVACTRALGFTGRIIWRPKPSTIKRGIAEPVAGCDFDSMKHGLTDTLRRCRLLVTHGSAIACDAIWAGVPVVALGKHNPAWSMASHSLDIGLYAPVWPTDAERLAWCRKLAGCQFTLDEITAGFVWDHWRRVRGLLDK